MLNNLHQIDDDIIEECARLLIINNANNHSIKIFRYGFFDLFKNFQKIPKWRSFYKKINSIYRYFFKRVYRNILGIYQFFINLLLIKTFYMTILKQRNFKKN